jgi:hypothetical protein
MKNARTEITASFLIRGFGCDHDHITRQIGIDPSATWRKGDQIGQSRLRRKEDGWRLDSELSPQAALDQHARNILDRIHPRSAALTSIEGRAHFFAAMYIHAGDRPPATLSSEIIRQLADLNAGVDIDIYNL